MKNDVDISNVYAKFKFEEHLMKKHFPLAHAFYLLEKFIKEEDLDVAKDLLARKVLEKWDEENLSYDLNEIEEIKCFPALNHFELFENGWVEYKESDDYCFCTSEALKLTGGITQDGECEKCKQRALCNYYLEGNAMKESKRKG